MTTMLEALNPEQIARAQQGDSATISDLYDRYRLSVYRYLYYKVGDLHAAEDLTSEVFLRMIRSLNSYRPQNSSFEAWLFQIARNLAIDHYRQKNTRGHLSLEEHMIHDTDDPDQKYDRSLTSDLLLKALSRLSEVQRDVIVLRFVNGLPITQVAQTLHKSEDAVKGLQRRALGSLREILTEWEVTYA
ncbi:MAG TPA: sigma-70 family RNA polymerase sigma factor [Anaerolineales bacterium]